MRWSPAIILLLHVAVLLSTSPTTTTTTAFTIHTSSITSIIPTTITSSSSVLYGSIYAPGSDKEDEEGLNRDHLGRLVPKSDDKGATSSPTSSSSSSSATSSTSSTTPATTPQKVPIRFINFETIGGQERVAYAEPNANILKVADEAGVKIPRQCRSGLCGSCTTDVKDPTWTEGERLGYQTVRACQAGAILPAGCEEMVLDCFRIGSSSGAVGSGAAGVTVESGSVSMDKKPLMNFEDGWEDDFSPDYKTSSSTSTSENGTIEVVKKTTPEFTVKHGERSTIEIEKPHWTPRIDANIPPWETVW